MAIRNNSNKNVRKNTYKDNEPIKSKSSRIKNLFTRKNKTIKTQSKSINKSEIQNIFKLVFSFILALSIFGSIVWGSIAIYQYTMQSEYFLLKKITFSGNKFMTDKELMTLTKLELDNNILAYKINQIEVQLLQSPWIENVRIKRSLPDKMFIEIEEKEPIFWATKDNVLYYLDKNANFIAPVSKEKFISLPTIDVKHADNEAIKSLPNFIDMLKIAELPFSINEISWFSINPGKGYELHLDTYNLNISVAVENWERNIQNLVSVMRDLKKRNEISRIKEIRAAHNQVTIVKN